MRLSREKVKAEGPESRSGDHPTARGPVKEMQPVREEKHQSEAKRNKNKNFRKDVEAN